MSEQSGRRIAIVTGGSRGIGRAIAVELAGTAVMSLSITGPTTRRLRKPLP